MRPNPSIERTLPGKPVSASHVKTKGFPRQVNKVLTGLNREAIDPEAVHTDSLLWRSSVQRLVWIPRKTDGETKNGH